jgi:hypothetical protein
MTGMHQEEQSHETNRMRDTRNFWKWLALVSWISLALAGMLRMFPLH